MKKYIGFIIVLFVFVLGALNAEAAVNPSTPCASTATPSITVLSPNGGEVYQPGQQIEVKWKSCNVSSNENLQIGLYVDIGNNYGVITSSMYSNTGYGIINIPLTNYTNSNAVSNKYIVMISSYNLGINAKSNIFTIKTPTAEVSPYIKVLSPNGGEVVNISNPLTVTFKSNNVAPARHYINLVDVNDDHSYSLDSLLGSYGLQLTQTQINQATQSMTVSIPVSLNLNLNHDYKIEICVNNICDKSDNTFKIKSIFGSSDCMSNSSPSVTVLSPNGGEVYQAGQQIEVKWKSCNSSSLMVLIGLSSSLLNEGTEITTTQNDGKEIITLPTYMGQGNPPLASGNYYKIGIELGGSPNLSDKSDNTFTINSSSPFSSKFPPGCNSAVGFSATTGLPCFIETNPATSIAKNSAVLNGRLIANAPTDVYFLYKKTSNFTNEMQSTTKIVQNSNGLFSLTLSGLWPSISYDYKACMYYMGAERCAKQLTFTTLANSEIQEEEIVVDNIIIQEETGCSKGEKYSSTTGQICTQYGCKQGENYSSATGKACSKPISISPSGCNSFEGNSLTTGVECAASCSVSGAGCGMVGSTPAMSGKILKQGVKDEEVKILQSFLNLTADGSFGPKTMNAVKLFQAQKGITADGVVGPKTWMYINK